MELGQEVYVHGYIDEIRKDIAIIRNDGGYFGTIPDEIRLKSDLNDEDKIREEGHIEAWYILNVFLGMSENLRYAVFSERTVDGFVHAFAPKRAIMRYQEYLEEQNKKATLFDVGNEIYSELTNSRAIILHIDSWGTWDCLGKKGTFKIPEEQQKYWVCTGKTYSKTVEFLMSGVEEKNGAET